MIEKKIKRKEIKRKKKGKREMKEFVPIFVHWNVSVV